MELGYTGLLAIWYDSWLCVLGLAASVVLTAMISVRADWRGIDTAVVALMALSALGCLPLAMLRMGMLLAIDDPTPVGYLNILATIVAVGLAGARLYTWYQADRAGLSPVDHGESMEDEHDDPLYGSNADTDPNRGGSRDILTLLPEGVTPRVDLDMPTIAQSASSLAPPAYLYFTNGPMAGQNIPLPAGTVTLGRGLENDIVLDDPTASRDHASIAFDGGVYYVEDTNSMGGTMVEGMPAAGRSILSSGSTLKMGDSEIMFVRDDDASSNPGSVEAPAFTSGITDAGVSETLMPDQVRIGVNAWLMVTSGPSQGKSYQLNEGRQLNWAVG